jgi:hypothetical protein
MKYKHWFHAWSIGSLALVVASIISGAGAVYVILGVAVANLLVFVRTNPYIGDHADSVRYLGRMIGALRAAARVVPVLFIIRACVAGRVLALVDEILSGTDSADRISASIDILGHLGGTDSLVVAATHDLEIATAVTGRYDARHFSEKLDSGDFSFDYEMQESEPASGIYRHTQGFPPEGPTRALHADIVFAEASPAPTTGRGISQDLLKDRYGRERYSEAIRRA